MGMYIFGKYSRTKSDLEMEQLINVLFLFQISLPDEMIESKQDKNC